ncbi:FGGY family carbohydrate kinase [Candidatus Enterococcus ferrettii]|uniref:gluconokinase n=1 Tax=Candidatus Enterococcus ferrettii TaxID=2815324 RepID=UPI001A9ACA84|nr:gluconokinase [Enterococcus sp. 665A]
MSKVTKAFLGIDVGTTAIKLGIIAENQLLYQTAINLKTYVEGPIKYQQSAELEQAFVQGIKEIPTELRQQVGIISFSTAMHSVMPVVDGVKGKIFIWSDEQASQVIEEFKHTDLAKHFYQRTGTPIHPMSPFAKILYFGQQKSYPKNVHWWGIKELLMEYFTGKARVDYSIASATGLFNLETQKWDSEILAYLEVAPKQLAELTDTTAAFPIHSAAAANLGLPAEAKVITGASDGCLTAYASFYRTGNTSSLTIGTSTAVRNITEQAHFDEEKQNFCYYLDRKHYVIGAPSNNGGCVLAWAAQAIGEPATFYQQLPKTLAASPLGAKGLRFFPYLNGERAPFWSSNKKAEFKHLTIEHTKADMIRGVLEGMLMNVRILTGMVGARGALSVSGGFFQTSALTQMTADLLGLSCMYAEENEPLFGLYYLIQQPERIVEAGKTFVPDESCAKEYQMLAKEYFKE